MGGSFFRCCIIGLLGLILVVQGSPQGDDDTDDDYDYNGGDEDHSEEQPDDRTEKPIAVTPSHNKNWHVTATLFKEASKTAAGNLIFSPLSLTTSMVMLKEGVEDKTASEIQNLFKFENNSVLQQANLIKFLTNQTLVQDGDSGVKLETASRIFANEKNANLLDTYTKAVSTLGEVETLDFTQPEKVVAHMNEWVKNKTHGKISKIAGGEDFNRDTAAVLLNTLYFKAPWKYQFKKHDTETQDFHVSKDEKVKVEMMYISAEFPYADLSDVEASVIFLPYKGDKISMIIYLPHDHEKLSTLEEKLGTLVPSRIRNQATPIKISVGIPKFNISSSLDFKQILTGLGIRSMFNETVADFSKMSTSPLYVSKLVQQVFIQVDEEGAEAASLTETNLPVATSAGSDFKANRPFIFQIVDDRTGAILLSGRLTNPSGSKKPLVVTQFERENWQVAAALYREAQKTKVGNLIFSPLSLSTSMVMLNEGAQGETAREIQTLFKFPRDSTSLIRSQTELLDSLKHQAGVEFEIASRIFANEENSNLLESYGRAVSSLGDVETLDFTEPKTVVAHMNEWVKNKTHEKILKIAEDQDFDPKTAAVLLNTLYFKAPWETPFNKSDTKTKDFHVSKNETVKVEMMYISAEFPYVELNDVGASVIFLPYKGDRFSMVIYLAWAGKNLSTLEEKLETLVPSEVYLNTTNITISLHLPKFNISSSLDFKQIFNPLGIRNMFNESAADFSKMSESRGFHVSKLEQQVFIQVDEEGAEAAALTEFHTLGPVSKPTVFEVDRPFIFQIFDSSTQTVLLTGRVTNPNGNLVPLPVTTPAPTSTTTNTSTTTTPKTSTSTTTNTSTTTTPKTSTTTNTSTTTTPKTSTSTSTTIKTSTKTKPPTSTTTSAPSDHSQGTHGIPPNSINSTSTSSPVEKITNKGKKDNATVNPDSPTPSTTPRPNGNGSGAQNLIMAPLLIICMSWLIM